MNVCLLGTDLSNANYGCRALGISTIKILQKICDKHGEKLATTVFVSDEKMKIASDDVKCDITLIQIRYKDVKFYKKVISQFANCDLIIDFTGGDSFSDIYGLKRFFLNSIIKEMAIKSKKKFIMGPQTIGPFEKKVTRLWASHILKRSACVFARDVRSFDYSIEISGVRPIAVTDVAFELPYTKTEKTEKREKVRVGINPSGLLWFKNGTFNSEKRMCVNYREYILGLVAELIKNDKYEVHLIPHVFSLNTKEYDEFYSNEDDMQACLHIQKHYPEVIIEKELEQPMDVKSVISTMDVFTGARMHATIAAFSSHVPVIPFSYSRKFEGLFGGIGYDYLISGESMDTNGALCQTINWIENRDKLGKKIAEICPSIEEKINRMYIAIEHILYEER